MGNRCSSTSRKELNDSKLIAIRDSRSSAAGTVRPPARNSGGAVSTTPTQVTSPVIEGGALKVDYATGSLVADQSENGGNASSTEKVDSPEKRETTGMKKGPSPTCSPVSTGSPSVTGSAGTKKSEKESIPSSPESSQQLAASTASTTDVSPQEEEPSTGSGLKEMEFETAKIVSKEQFDAQGYREVSWDEAAAMMGASNAEEARQHMVESMMASFRQQMEKKAPAITGAVIMNDPEFLREMLACPVEGAKLNEGHWVTGSPLFAAIRNRHDEMVDILLEDPRIDVNYVHKETDCSILIQALARHNERVALKLLDQFSPKNINCPKEKWLDINHVDDIGASALILAANEGAIAVVDKILENFEGIVDVNIKSIYGKSAIMLATENYETARAPVKDIIPDHLELWEKQKQPWYNIWLSSVKPVVQKRFEHATFDVTDLNDGQRRFVRNRYNNMFVFPAIMEKLLRVEGIDKTEYLAKCDTIITGIYAPGMMLSNNTSTNNAATTTQAASSGGTSTTNITFSFMSGDKVEIHGLEGSPQHNGKKAEVVKRKEENDGLDITASPPNMRYEVRVPADNNLLLSVKAKNLKKIEPNDRDRSSGNGFQQRW